MMKVITAILFSFVGFWQAFALTDVPDTAHFGAKDARGAYQEVHIRTLTISPDYFESLERHEFEMDAKKQNDDGIWADSNPRMGSWGRRVALYFQDGELKTINPYSAEYRRLDETKAHAVVSATLAFDNAEQAQLGFYKVSGVVTLVNGVSAWGPYTFGLKIAEPQFRYSSTLSNIGSGSEGGQFNKFGNGRNDGGRVKSVGLVSTDPNQKLTIGLLKSSMGSFVRVVYP